MSARRCEEWQEAILDRLVNELPDGEAILLEQHLSECAECSRQERSLRALIEGMGPLEAFPMSRASEEDLLRRIRSRDAQERIRARGAAPRSAGPAWGRISRIVLRPIPAYVAVILLVASCLVVWVEGRKESEQSVSSTSRPSAPAPALRRSPLESPREGRTPRNEGFVVTPSDALCLVGILGSDTL